LLFLKSVLLGLSVAAPVGPIGLLCINRTLNNGRLSGFFTGLGAATADMIYASFAAFGFSIVTQYLIQQQGWLQLFGGLFLFYLGIKIFMSKPANQAANLEGSNLFNMFFSTLLLTITNPATILSFVAMFAGLGLAANSNSLMDAFSLVSGVFLGSAIWWLILSNGVYLFKAKLVPYLSIINKTSGLLITVLAILSLLSVWRYSV
jgi:threonine/homoserine/homoserine lactone efflux protein